MHLILKNILLKIGVKTCPRCDRLFFRERGSIIVAQGPCPEDEGGGLFIESAPTCCLPDEVHSWIMEEI